MDDSMTPMEKMMKTLGKSMNTMEKQTKTKTMEKSMDSANGKSQLQNSTKQWFLLQNEANSKEKCTRLKNQKKKLKKSSPQGKQGKQGKPEEQGKQGWK